MVIWSQRYNHHPKKGEVYEAHQKQVVEQQKLSQLPLESNHAIKKETVN